MGLGKKNGSNLAIWNSWIRNRNRANTLVDTTEKSGVTILNTTVDTPEKKTIIIFKKELISPNPDTMDMQVAYTYSAFLSHGSFPNAFSTFPTFAVGQETDNRPVF